MAASYKDATIHTTRADTYLGWYVALELCSLTCPATGLDVPLTYNILCWHARDSHVVLGEPSHNCDVVIVMRSDR
jgi:hypothetical protein